jgi:hypothetical protein
MPFRHLHAPHLIPTDTPLGPERRAQLRVVHPRRVEVVRLTGGVDVVEVSSGCIRNISAGGAKLYLPQSVTEDEFWIRELRGAKADPFIECSVVWRDDIRCRPMYHVGVQFRCLLRTRFEELAAHASFRNRADTSQQRARHDQAEKSVIQITS